MNVSLGIGVSVLENEPQGSLPNGEYEWAGLSRPQQIRFLDFFKAYNGEGVTFTFLPEDLRPLGAIKTISSSTHQVDISTLFDSRRYSAVTTKRNSLENRRVIDLEQIPIEKNRKHQTVTLARVTPDTLFLAMQNLLKKE